MVESAHKNSNKT